MKFDSADLRDRKPKQDDVSVCYHCTSFLAFNPDLSLRLLTEEEIGDLDDEIRNALIAYRRYKKQSNEISETYDEVIAILGFEEKEL